MNGQYRVGDVVLGHWRLERQIGEGSYGRVFEAVRTDYDGYEYKAAIKVITVPQTQSEIKSVQAEGMDIQTATNYFQSFVDELVQEFKLMADLKGYSNVVSYEDHKVIKHEDGIGWDIIIRMELLTPLLDYLQNNTPDKQEIIRLGIDICKALELCQKYNVIHRDIKPENIFVSKMGDFKLGDFGIARTVEKTTGGLSKKGTYTYMAPEVFREKAYGFDVDTYSLGIVLYRLLNGNRAPFLPPYPELITHSDRENALARRIKGDPIPAPANADEKLAQVVLKACAYQPEDRFKSPAHMRLALELLQDKSAELLNLMELTGNKEATTEKKEAVKATVNESVKVAVSEPVKEVAQNAPVENANSDRTMRMAKNEAKDAEVEKYDMTELLPSAQAKVIREEAPKTEGKSAAFARDSFGKGKRKAEGDEKNKKLLVPILVGAAALVVIGGIVIGGMGGGSGETSQPKEPQGVETPDGSVVTEPEDETEVIVAEWSDWVEELPDFVNSAEYVMETKKMYQSAPALIFSQETPEAGDLCYTKSGDFGEWSPWQSEKVEPSKDLEVETKVSYQYRTLQSKTTYREDKSIVGGRVTVTSYYWGNWTNSNSPVKANKSREVRTYTKYRYRTRTMMYYYAPQDGWSEPTETPIYPDDENMVRVYDMYRYMPIVEAQELVGSMDHFTQAELDAEIRFADIPETRWYAPAKNSSIVHALNLQIMDTTDYMCFRPEENITVGELIKAAAMIHRTYYGLPGQFAEDENSLNAYVEYAAENNIINKKMFANLDKLADRQETAYILYAALPEAELLPINTVKTVTDMDKASLYYERVYRFAEAGIVAWPTPEYEFNPDQLVTRAEVAVMVNALVHQELRSGS